MKASAIKKIKEPVSINSRGEVEDIFKNCGHFLGLPQFHIATMLPPLNPRISSQSSTFKLGEVRGLEHRLSTIG